MNRDDIAYSIPAYENDAERYAMSDGPIMAGEMGAGTLMDTPESYVAAAKIQGIDNHNAWRRNKGMRELSVMEFLNND